MAFIRLVFKSDVENAVTLELDKKIDSQIMEKILADKEVAEKFIKHLAGDTTKRFWLFEKAKNGRPDAQYDKLYKGEYLKDICEAHATFKKYILQNAEQLTRDKVLTRDKIESIQTTLSETEETVSTPRLV